MHTASLTISAYNISQAIVVLFIGVVSDLVGRRPTLLVCLALHIGASASIAATGSLPWMIAMRVVQAAGSGAVYIVLRLAIKDSMDRQAQVHATGLLVTGLVLSPILAPLAGAWIIGVSDWRGCFWAIAVLEAALFLWAWRAIGESNHQQGALRAAFSRPAHGAAYASVLKDGYFGGLALAVGASFAAFYLHPVCIRCGRHHGRLEPAAAARRELRSQHRAVRAARCRRLCMGISQRARGAAHLTGQVQPASTTKSCAVHMTLSSAARNSTIDATCSGIRAPGRHWALAISTLAASSTHRSI